MHQNAFRSLALCHPCTKWKNQTGIQSQMRKEKGFELSKLGWGGPAG